MPGLIRGRDFLIPVRDTLSCSHVGNSTVLLIWGIVTSLGTVALRADSPFASSQGLLPRELHPDSAGHRKRPNFLAVSC